MNRFQWATWALAFLLAATSVASAKRVTVTIEGLKYHPATVEVEAGDTVVWTNKDDREHTVTADDGSFDSGRMAKGKSYSRTFGTAGTFKYGSDPSPRTKGTVVVK